MSVRDAAKDAGLTLADVGELLAPPKPRSWADAEERSDEIVEAMAVRHTEPPPRFGDEQIGEAIDEPREAIAAEFNHAGPAELPPDVDREPRGGVVKVEHRRGGRTVTSWFARR